MARYRKKPVEIEAIRWTGGNEDEIIAFTNAEIAFAYPFVEIDTLEGLMLANRGDYIIRGVKGEFYPCKPDIFKATYEAID